MKKAFFLLTAITLIFALDSARSIENDNMEEWWDNARSPVELTLDHVEIRAYGYRVDEFKRGGSQTLGGPGSGPGTSNFCMDGYTAPTWASASPSVSSIEQYEFNGGAFATIDHRVVIRNAAGPWPTSVGLAFAWQSCGNSKIFPPVPRTYGMSIDGNTMLVTLPYSGIWYITGSFDNFVPLVTYDWVWMARFDGQTPIHIPVSYPPTDAIGGDINEYNEDNSLHNVTDDIGDGQGSGRPWCFLVNP